jgi:hypothetical protein
MDQAKNNKKKTKIKGDDVEEEPDQPPDFALKMEPQNLNGNGIDFDVDKDFDGFGQG